MATCTASPGSARWSSPAWLWRSGSSAAPTSAG